MLISSKSPKIYIMLQNLKLLFYTLLIIIEPCNIYNFNKLLALRVVLCMIQLITFWSLFSNVLCLMPYYYHQFCFWIITFNHIFVFPIIISLYFFIFMWRNETFFYLNLNVSQTWYNRNILNLFKMLLNLFKNTQNLFA